MIKRTVLDRFRLTTSAAESAAATVELELLWDDNNIIAWDEGSFIAWD